MVASPLRRDIAISIQRLRKNRKIVILSEAKNLSFFDFART